jgi:hypothetical protein
MDHFRPPLSERRHWHAFHHAWATFLAADLNRQLPEGYFAEPNVQLRRQPCGTLGRLLPAHEGKRRNGIGYLASLLERGGSFAGLALLSKKRPLPFFGFGAFLRQNLP